MALSWGKKDPDSVLDYSVDWSNWLPTGDTIATSTWTIPAGLTKDSQSATTTVAVVWLSGGTAGTDYEIINRIVTAEGRTQDQTMSLKCRER